MPGNSLLSAVRSRAARSVSLSGRALKDPRVGLLVADGLLRGRHRPPSSVELSLQVASAAEVARTERAFASAGSDKTTSHSYGPMYAALLQALPHRPLILELGIGTNFTDVACNMGMAGVPGASLRAMRELRPDACLFGADIDKRVLFQEPSIMTYWVDQLDRTSLRSLSRKAAEQQGFDLVIDDGLHTKRSNLNSFEVLFPTVKPGGFYVVEDIDGTAITFWRGIIRRRRLLGTILDMREVRNWGLNVAVVIQAQ